MFKKKRMYRCKSRMKDNTYKINFLIIFIIVLAFILGIFFIKLGTDYENAITPIYSYEANKNANYEVLLKPNDFYESNILASGGYYASKSIDSYKIDFDYNFKANKEANIDYSYNITANIVGTVSNNNDNGKEVWNRTFTLLENKDVSVYEDEFSIKEPININYDYYNNLARSYEENYGITINAVLKLSFNISYNIDISNLGLENETDKDAIKLDIYLTDTVTNAEENYEKITSKTLSQSNLEIATNKKIYYIIGGIFIVFSISLIIIMIKQNKKAPVEIYKNNIRRILKYYKDLIVTVTNEPVITDLKVMKIDSLDDLIDVAEQNKSNIIHYEVTKNMLSKLYVIINNYVYIYTVTDKKLKM